MLPALLPLLGPHCSPFRFVGIALINDNNSAEQNKFDTEK